MVQVLESGKRYGNSVKGKASRKKRQRRYRKKLNFKEIETHHSSVKGPVVIPVGRTLGFCICCGAQITTFVRGIDEYYWATRTAARIDTT